MNNKRNNKPNNKLSNKADKSKQKKAHAEGDLKYMRSLSAAVIERSPKKLIMTVQIICVFVVVAILWMNWAEIDVLVRGSGKVIPARQVQLVQSLEGGVVAEILVKEGDLVSANQPLIKLSEIAFSSSFQENRLLYYELRARSLRLTAEAHGSEFVNEAELEKLAPEALHSEEGLYKSNKQQLDETLSILSEQVQQQDRVLEEAQSKARQLTRTLKLLKKEVKIKKPLVKDGIISEIEYLQLQQRESEVEGELEIADIAVPRIQSSIEEAKGKLAQGRLDFSNQAKRELNEVLAEISRISQTQTALQDRVSRTTLRSPVKGVVKRLHANSIGGVISPGGQVLEIVPLGESLLVEVKIKPADIASISIGQLTRLKFSAYDFAIHGSLSGKVIFVSADTVTEDDGASFYIVRVEPDKSYLGRSERQMFIKVGMTSDADIIIDKKTILEYLLKPINRGLERALTES
jgi:adhesin transport system membrane fusion protein